MMIRRLTLAAAAVAAFSSAAFAADVAGEWKRDDGKAKVRFAALRRRRGLWIDHLVA